MSTGGGPTPAHELSKSPASHPTRVLSYEAATRSLDFVVHSTKSFGPHVSNEQVVSGSVRNAYGQGMKAATGGIVRKLAYGSARVPIYEPSLKCFTKRG